MEYKISGIPYEDIFFKYSPYQYIKLNLKLIYKEEDPQYVSSMIDTYGSFPSSYVEIPEDIGSLFHFMTHYAKIQGYCPFCKRDTVFLLSTISLPEEVLFSIIERYDIADGDFYETSESGKFRNKMNMLKQYQYFDKRAVCSYNNDHQLNFNFHIKFKETEDNFEISFGKIGQYPSYVDFSDIQFKRYETLLKDIECYSEYKKAAFSYNHQFAIGAFAYMRRVFEMTLKHKFNKAKDTLNMSFDDFIKKSGDVKIDILKDQLPEYLFSNKVLYGILSAGIHFIDEDKCRESFPIIRDAVDAILEDEIVKQETEKRNRVIKQGISRTHNDFNNEFKELVDRVDK